MKIRTMIMASLAVGFFVVGCGQVPAGGNGGSTPATELELTYVSGHLGNYWDCPDKASSETQARAEKADQAPSGAPAEQFAGDCADDDCGMMNCEDAVLTFRIRNIGVTEAEAIEVTDIEFIPTGSADVVALDVLAVARADGQAYTANLSPDEVMILRVDFAGPWEGNFASGSGALRIVILTSDGRTVELVTPELQHIPSVAT